jgi:hypothetical protein
MPVDSTLRDQHELKFFAGLQDQRAVLANDREFMQNSGFLKGQVPVKPVKTALEAREDDMAIVNRSPTTVNHYHAPPPQVPWRTILLACAIALAAWFFQHWKDKPKPEPGKPPAAGAANDYNVGLFDP